MAASLVLPVERSTAADRVACGADQCTVTFPARSTTAFTVPAGVTSIRVSVAAGSGGGQQQTGGAGGRFVARIAVTPGTTLTGVVGGAGANLGVHGGATPPRAYGGGGAGGWREFRSRRHGEQVVAGAGGGGGSFLFVTTHGSTALLAAAGGGGGAGYRCVDPTTGNRVLVVGGSGGSAGSAAAGKAGRLDGGGDASSFNAGTGGTTAAGGAAGTFFGQRPQQSGSGGSGAATAPAALGIGGDGPHLGDGRRQWQRSSAIATGGGGGGVYGGGGGSYGRGDWGRQRGCVGAGGGGAGFLAKSAELQSTTTHRGDGELSVSFARASATSTTVSGPARATAGTVTSLKVTVLGRAGRAPTGTVVVKGVATDRQGRVVARTVSRSRLGGRDDRSSLTRVDVRIPRSSLESVRYTATYTGVRGGRAGAYLSSTSKPLTVRIAPPERAPSTPPAAKPPASKPPAVRSPAPEPSAPRSSTPRTSTPKSPTSPRTSPATKPPTAPRSDRSRSTAKTAEPGPTGSESAQQGAAPDRRSEVALGSNRYAYESDPGSTDVPIGLVGLRSRLTPAGGSDGSDRTLELVSGALMLTSAVVALTAVLWHRGRRR